MKWSFSQNYDGRAVSQSFPISDCSQGQRKRLLKRSQFFPIFFFIEELLWRRVPDVSIQKVSVSIVEVHRRPGTHGRKQINLVWSSTVQRGASSLGLSVVDISTPVRSPLPRPFTNSPSEKQLLLLTNCHLVEEAEESLFSKTVASKSLLSCSCKCQST